jgi:hypothetical protein
MFRFIKKLFSKEEIEEEKVSLEDLNSWLDEKSKLLFDDLNVKIDEIIQKIKDEKNVLYENLNILENAELQNSKIPERAKTIMEGNRSGFIKRVLLFFDNIDLKYDEYEDLIAKCKNIENQINLLGKSTSRNYQVLNEFFAREAEKSAMNIKNVENYAKQLLSSINTSKISSIDKIKKMIIDLKNKIKLKESYSLQFVNNKKSIESNKGRKAEIENKIKELKSNAEYRAFEKMHEESEKTKSKISVIEKQLLHDFSTLEKSLKKYSKIAFENEKQILDYLDNSIITLVKDTDFKIIKILDSLKGSISRGELELDEKKQSRAIQKIDELDGVYFNKMREDYKDAKARLNDLNYKISCNNSKKVIEASENELVNVNGNIKKNSDEILNLTKELEKINIDELKKRLLDEIYNVVKVKITLL